MPWRKPKRNHVKDCPQKPRCNHKVTFLVKAGSLDRYIDRRKLAGRIKKKKKKIEVQLDKLIAFVRLKRV